MVERLGVMRKGRRERIEKGSREGIEKETKRQFEEKEYLRDPALLEFLDLTLRCSHCFFKSSSWSSSIKGYAESPEFSPALRLIIFGEKSVATNLR